MSKVYVLSVWARDGDPPEDGDAPIRLRLFDTESGAEPEVLATHDEGFDTAPITLPDGSPMDIDTCLTTQALAKGADVDAIGDELWRRLTPGTIRAELAAVALDHRVQLDLRTFELQRYPWEFLRIDHKTPFAHEAAGNPARWSMGAPTLAAVASTPSDHPLRILLVIGNNPKEEAEFKSGGEVFHVEGLANRYKTEVLIKAVHRPSVAQLKDELARFRPHVFHFIGHGEMYGDEPQLLVYRQTGTDDEDKPKYGADRWNADTLKDLFGLSAPRLVVLNACLSADSKRVTTSLPAAFLELGTRAVVAMTERILTEASVGFADHFYRELLDGQPVDAAVNRARIGVRSVVAGTSQLKDSWPLIRTFVNGPAEDAVELTCEGSSKRKWMARDFIARWDERWDAWRLIDGSTSRLALLVGNEKSGRSQVLGFLGDACVRAGDAVIYVDLSQGKTGTWRDVLAAIARQAAAVDGVDATELEAIVAELEPANAADPEPDQQRAFGLFAAALEKCSASGRVVVAISGLGSWQVDLVKETLGGFYELFAEAKPNSRVRLALTLPGTQLSYDLGLDEDEWRPIPIGPFPIDEWDRGVKHFIADQSDHEEDRQRLFELVAALQPFDGATAELLELTRDKAAKLRKKREAQP